MRRITVVLLAFLLGFFLLIPSVLAKDIYKTKGQFMGTWTKADQKMIISFYNQGDVAAALSMVLEGRAFFTEAGWLVSLEETTWGGLVRVRRIGKTKSFWTIRDELTKP